MQQTGVEAANVFRLVGAGRRPALRQAQNDTENGEQRDFQYQIFYFFKGGSPLSGWQQIQ